MDDTPEESVEASRYRVIEPLIYQPNVAPYEVRWSHIGAELILLSAFWNERDLIPDAQQVYARRMGQELFRMGGEQLMKKVYYEVQSRNPYALILQHYWDGIGDWQA